MTGTPVLNSLMDIFQQYRILDGGETFGKNFFAFRSRYFEDKNAGFAHKHNYFPDYVPRPQSFAELNKKIYSKASRVLKSETLDLPPFISVTRDVEMGPEQKRMYNEMKKEFITFVKTKQETETKAVVAQLAVTKALRLQQIVAGFVKDEDGVTHSIPDSKRLGVLKEIVEEITPTNKVIVWACFKENYSQIAKMCFDLGLEHVEIHGDVSTRDKERSIDRFTKDEQCRVMIANQASGGIGINLVEASYSVFYSKNFSLEQDIQAEGRNYRGGSEQHAKITRIDLVSPGTIDELVLKALREKQKMSDLILTLT
jgi:SNF2 family DNA or RNA helicase